MKLKFRPRYAVIAAVNAAAIIGAAVLTAVGGSMAKSQRYNYAADLWDSDGKNGYTQISCFLSEDSGFTADSVMSVRSQLMYRLQSAAVVPEEGKTLCPDAWSAPLGQANVTCDISGSSGAEITAVGGEFFMFRRFDLLDGAFFCDSDIMQDGAVIDRSLAWSLYGSDKVAGMSIYINGEKFYISGVIDTPRTRYEKDCAGELPRAYISYEAAFSAAEQYSYAPEAGGQTKFSKITCYECIVPDPVENFAITAVRDIFETSCSGRVSVVKNTERFAPSERAKALKKLHNYAVRDDAVKLPYWENASRIVEFRLTYIYAARRGLLAVPAVTLLWVILWGSLQLKRNKKRILKAIGDRLGRIFSSAKKKIFKTKERNI